MRNGLYMYFMGISFTPPITLGNKGHPQAAGPSAGAPAAAVVGAWLYQLTHLPSRAQHQASEMNIQPTFPTERAPQPRSQHQGGVTTTQTQYLLHPYVHISTTLHADSRGGNWVRCLQQTTRRTQLSRPAPPLLSNPRALHIQQRQDILPFSFRWRSRFSG